MPSNVALTLLKNNFLTRAYWVLDDIEQDEDLTGKCYEDLTDEQRMEVMAKFLDDKEDIARRIINFELGAKKDAQSVYDMQLARAVKAAMNADMRHVSGHSYEVDGKRIYSMFGVNPDTGERVAIDTDDILQVYEFFNGNVGRLKRCIKCKIDKGIYHFSKLKSSPDGRNKRCLQCERDRVRSYSQAKDKTQLCSECKRRKPFNQFHRDSTKPNGCEYRCKQCRKGK